MEQDQNILGIFLKEKRTTVGLSQADVAKVLGYSTPQFISNWERGISSPPINILKKLGQLYKVTSEEIFEVTLRDKVQGIKLDLIRKYNESK